MYLSKNSKMQGTPKESREPRQAIIRLWNKLKILRTGSQG